MKRMALRYFWSFFIAFGLGGCDLYPKIMNVGGTSTAGPNELYASNTDGTYGDAPASESVNDYDAPSDVGLYGKAMAPEMEYASATDYSSTRAAAIVADEPVVDTRPEPIVDVTSDYGRIEPNNITSPYLAFQPEADDVLLVPEKVAEAPTKVTVVEPTTDTVTVQKGDTVFAIAQRYDVPLRDLLEENKLSAPYSIRVGQKLKLPASRYHVVKSGETLYSVSRAYSVDLNSLAKENNLKEPYGLAVGQRLRLPGRVVTTDAAPAVVVVTAPAATTTTTATAAKTTATTPVASSTPAVTTTTKVSSTTSTGTVTKLPAATARTSTKFSWPVRGKILSAFGAKNNGLYNDGINIGARAGTVVKAAENGVVAYAGNELKGMGNLVIVQHTGGWMTVYAHMDTMAVKRGTKVSVGQKIGTVGQTGKVSEPQLHFEIRKGTKAYNPTSQLKK